MATEFIFDNKRVKIPNAYSRIISGIKNPAFALGFGNTLLIDTGSNPNYGGGAGISGELSKGKDAIYTFDSAEDFRNFVGGGLHYDLAQYLFRPSSLGVNGISTLTYVRAASTTAGTITYTFVGGGANGGVVTIKTKTEGLAANGAEVSSVLTRGYAGVMKAGTINTAKFVIEFYRGSYRGLDPANELIDGIAEGDTKPVLLARSDEFNNVSEFEAWAKSSSAFNDHFSLVSVVPAGTGAVDNADLVANAGNTLATGGTQTFNSTALNRVFECIKGTYFDFILGDKYGDTAQDAAMVSILGYIEQDAVVKPDLYIGGGIDELKFTQSNGSIPTAQFYNSQYVTVVHGGIKRAKRDGSGFVNLPSIYKAAFVLGREAGLAPQVPLSFKSLNIQGEVHGLSDKEVIQLLDAGVIATRFEDGVSTFDIVKGINTLQNNKFLVNEDGTTPSKQIRRIVRQINKELIVNAKAQLLKQPNGVNRNTLSAEDLKNWVETYLLSITATPTEDNLILRFENVTVKRVQDAYFVEYAIVPNSEINFLFFTGILIED